MSERKNAARRAARGYTCPKPKDNRDLVASMRQAQKLITSLPPEDVAKFEEEFKNTSPVEVAKIFAARVLAYEVREHFRATVENRPLTEEDRAHFKKGGFDPPLGTMVHDLADFTDIDNVVEFLEQAVEGDAIIDSAEVTAWMRRKLGEYRDHCERIDAMSGEMNVMAVAINLRNAMHDHDILIEASRNLPHNGLIANGKGRAAFDPEGDVKWTKDDSGIMPDDWLCGPSVYREDGAAISYADMKRAATTLTEGLYADGRPVRVGLIVDKWAHVETLTVQAA
jgi:hypothetical protein